jgi:hypothetical protein
MPRNDREKTRIARGLLNDARKLAYPRPPKGSCGIGRRSEDALRIALGKCDQAVGFCPTLADAYIERSSLRRELGDDEGARADGLQAFELRPSDARSYIRLSFPFSRPEQRRIVQTAMRRLRGKPMDLVSLWHRVLDTFWYEGRFEDQVDEARKILRYRKRRRYFTRIDHDYSRLGSALEALGRYDEAELSYRRGLKSKYGQHLAPRLVLTKVRMNDFQGAEATLSELRGRMPRDLAGFLRSAIRGLQGESVRSPAKTLAKVTEENLHGGVGLYAFYAAVILLRMGREAEARDLLGRYVAHIESNPREWGITNRWEVAKAKELLNVKRLDGAVDA